MYNLGSLYVHTCSAARVIKRLFGKNHSDQAIMIISNGEISINTKLSSPFTNILGMHALSFGLFSKVLMVFFQENSLHEMG